VSSGCPRSVFDRGAAGEAIGNWIGGDTVTVRGTAFTTKEQTTLVFFDADRTLPLEVLEVVSENELQATTPEAPRIGLFSLRIENERGSAERAYAFEYGFVRGDADADGRINITDGVFILNFLFLGDIGPPCMDAADATDEANVNISDSIRLFSFLFLGADPPPAPYPGPGADPTTNDSLGCLDQPDGGLRRRGFCHGHGRPAGNRPSCGGARSGRDAVVIGPALVGLAPPAKIDFCSRRRCRRRTSGPGTWSLSQNWILRPRAREGFWDRPLPH